MFLDVFTTILTTYMLNALESDKKANWSFDICSPSHIWILYLWVVSLCTQQTSLSFFVSCKYILHSLWAFHGLHCFKSFLPYGCCLKFFVCLFVRLLLPKLLMFLSIGLKMIKLVPYLFPIVIVLFSDEMLYEMFLFLSKCWHWHFWWIYRILSSMSLLEIQSNPDTQYFIAFSWNDLCPKIFWYSDDDDDGGQFPIESKWKL